MAKAKYMALADFQTLWTDRIKPTLYSKTDVDGRTLQFAETEDPASQEVIDEYQRLTSGLYQALEDAQQVIAPAQQATQQATQQAADKASEAERAASAASSAAGRADSAADQAMDAAAEVDSAKGDYDSLGERLDTTEMGLVETSDPTTLLRM